ncbi:hypothetical protein E2542_SST18425 [Spatholobus suberectus]|nr:hypothetical protein E2542_SST18425 [Spatholobus suberectus]
MNSTNTRKHPISARNYPSPNAFNTSPVNFRRASPKTHLSARKLAARLWHFRFFEVSSSPRPSSHFPNSKLESSPPRVKRTEEEVAKRANTHSRKLLRERKLIGDSVVSVVLSELLRAQTCINKLKAEHKSFKKKLYEEKLLWKSRELQKSEAVLGDLKDKLARERRSRERMESLNAKLVHDLAEAKLYAKQFMINYEEEKRRRELIEEVCNELASQIGEDEAKLEGLQRYSTRIREEMEQERKMFQMAELWREESIQMKLLDAKLAMEDKYSQMIQLIARLQSFLRSRGDELGAMELRDAQLIKQAVEYVNIERVTELSCDFTKSNDVLSIFEELKIKERGIEVEPYYPSNLVGPTSTVHIVSLDEDSVLHQSSISLDNVNQNINGSGSEAECCENGCYEHSDSVAQQNSEDSTFGKCEGRLARSAVKSGGIGSTFICKDGSGESGFRQWELLGQRNIADSVNPHITRGMKGCIEWPRGIPKINSKVIPLEERVRKQKSQLQHMFKPQA